MCEVKSSAELDDPVVRAKAAAAATWCKRASEHEISNGGKPWKYLLIPHDALNGSVTLNALGMYCIETGAPDASE